MPVLLAIISALTVAGVWYYRMSAAKDTAGNLLDAANDVRLAARRFGYNMRNKTHPTDSVDDPRLAAAGIVLAIAAMDSELTKAEMDALIVQCQSKFNVDKTEAEEIAVFGRWLSTTTNTKDEAVRRLCKRVVAKAGQEAGPDLIEMIEKVAGPEGLADDRAADSLATVKRLLGAR